MLGVLKFLIMLLAFPILGWAVNYDIEKFMKWFEEHWQSAVSLIAGVSAGAVETANQTISVNPNSAAEIYISCMVVAIKVFITGVVSYACARYLPKIVPIGEKSFLGLLKTLKYYWRYFTTKNKN